MNKPYIEEELTMDEIRNNTKDYNTNKKERRELSLKDLENRLIVWHNKKPLDIAVLILTLAAYLDINIDEFLDTAIQIRERIRKYNKKQDK